MHDFGGIKAEAGSRFTTMLPVKRGSVRLEIHVQWSEDGKTYYQAMRTTTPEVVVTDGVVKWLAALGLAEGDKAH